MPETSGRGDVMEYDIDVTVTVDDETMISKVFETKNASTHQSKFHKIEVPELHDVKN